MADRVGPADPRAFAWDALQQIEAGGFSDTIVGTGLDRVALQGPDRALATSLVYGTVTWQGFLDYILAGIARRPVAAIDPPVRTLLRLALFQICKLDRVPDFAVVHTAVELCKRRTRRGAGFVNAILRRAATEWRDVPLPSADRDPAGFLAVHYSHPRWLVERWLDAYGPAETEALLAANNLVAPTVVRVNRRHTDRAGLLARWQEAGIQGQRTKFSSDGVEVQGEAAATRLPGYGSGHFAFQGEASQLACALVGARPGERVLDLCAAPGGKACQLGDAMENRGEIVAVDASRLGIGRLEREAARQGLTLLHAEIGDATLWSPGSAPPFDRILVDAPCTGFGTLRQHPEIRWRRSPADVDANAKLQERILRNASRLLRPGGVLVYATCTIGALENDAVVRAVCADGALQLDPAGPHLAGAATRCVDSDGFLRTLPHRDGLDGFFAARLLRREAESSVPG